MVPLRDGLPRRQQVPAREVVGQSGSTPAAPNLSDNVSVDHALHPLALEVLPDERIPDHESLGLID